MKWLPFGYLLAAILALAACQAHGPVAPPQIVVHEVAVPTPVACVPAATPEHQPARTATPEALGRAGLDDMLAAITAELVRRRAYDDQVEPVLAACRAAGPSP
jgi:hypothetical protein